MIDQVSYVFRRMPHRMPGRSVADAALAAATDTAFAAIRGSSYTKPSLDLGIEIKQNPLSRMTLCRASTTYSRSRRGSEAGSEEYNSGRR